jgi:hydroxymethylpyrimidine/phosphomethylpyrimidine kinase
MLGTPELTELVGDLLTGALAGLPVVLDPVLVATSGDALYGDGTVEALRRLLPLATVATPNLPELAALGGETAVRAQGCALLVKGGHGDGPELVDRLVDADGAETVWRDPRIDTPHTHGTGCTLASAMPRPSPSAMALADAVTRARLFVRIALHEAPGLGGGHGPMGHGRVRLDCDLGGATPNQITLPATDHAASLAFWRALGLRPIVDSGGRYARFESAGGVTLSIEAAHEMAGRAVVYLEVAELDALVARLRAAGHAFTAPVAQRWGWREARGRRSRWQSGLPLPGWREPPLPAMAARSCLA